jgi:hypothetical protein
MRTQQNSYDEIITRLRDLQDAADGRGNREEKPPDKIPLIDPTANVLSLVKAAIERQDDLRIAEARRFDDIRKIEERCSVEVGALRDKLTEAESRRIDAVNLMERSRVDAVQAEQKAAVALASEKTSAQAATLATQLSATATTTAAQIATLGDSLGKRISVVEQNQYQAGGATQQRGEGRQQNQWVIGLAVIIGIAVIEVMAKLWK